MRFDPRHPAVFGALLVALAIGLLLALFEPRRETVYRGFQGEAARNWLLALERWANRLGVTVETRADLEELPPPTAALLLLADRDRLDAPRVDRLFEWVASGGLLIVSAEVPEEAYNWNDEELEEEASSEAPYEPPPVEEDPELTQLDDGETEDGDGDPSLVAEEERQRRRQERASRALPSDRRPRDGALAPLPTDPEWAVSLADDPLLSPFGLGLTDTVWWQTELSIAISSLSEENWRVLTYRQPRLVTLPARDAASVENPAEPGVDAEQPAAAGFYDSDAGRIVDDPLPVHGHTSDDTGALAVWAYHGNGAVVALYDPDLLMNGWIGEQQNASLVWHLLAQVRDAAPDRLWIVRHITFPSLWDVLVDRSVPLSAALGLLLLLWLWHQVVRREPLHERPSSTQRNLAAHLRSSGDFYRRHRLLEVPLAAMRHRALRAAYAAQPGLLQTHGRQRLQGLTERAAGSRSDVARALRDEIVEDTDDFVERVRTLDALLRGPARERNERTTDSPDSLGNEE